MDRIAVKKARERKILDLIYSDRGVQEIIPSERPDFLLRSRNGTRFGVEIAELYHSQSTARLERIPGYVAHLLDGGPFLHKEDAQRIEVGEIDILSQNNGVVHSQVAALVQEGPSLENCVLSLGSMIRTKAQKFESPTTLRHVNLIIHDRTGAFSTVSAEDFCRLYSIPELRDSLAAASFREVFFLTKLKAGPGFVPLKMLLLAAEAYLFNSVYIAMSVHERFDRSVAELEVLGSYLASQVKGEVLFREEENGNEILYGDSGFYVGHDHSVCIRTYQDAAFPADARQPKHDLVCQLCPEFMTALTEFRSSNAFVMPLIFPTPAFKA